ncbi:MAG: 8-oxo-dGTP diphosphatase [Gemmatimonadetes bacterium]|nr:8-oxo-dGTP diphosphatase [Gemmatimonadota bacterium]MYD64019.1 8-oxo-dGTP diphosphatase [Gemmatimonadota bacterium]MYF72811.1 8-oxo-dGTP diphosphatase [Gemmatimonadota bacterium]MYK51411.1 8-oxo-dGTP diphosphatase [Gemmatimonadota bacterium]
MCIENHTTLILLVRACPCGGKQGGDPITHVLLGYKKRGFGVGKYTGIGGKIEPGETVRAAAVREMREETGVVMSVQDLVDAGHLTFYFPTRPKWSLTTRIFIGRRWQGEPTETGEIRPVWFEIDHLPFDAMWDDATYWYPYVLAHKRVRAIFTFSTDCKTVATSEIEMW